MKLSIGDEKAKDVALVKVNGKVVQLPIGFDTEEGWVDCYMPVVKSDLDTFEDKVAVESLEEPDFKVVRLTGKVEVWMKV
jgi:hypothetical protein